MIKYVYFNDKTKTLVTIYEASFFSIQDDHASLTRELINQMKTGSVIADWRILPISTGLAT